MHSQLYSEPAASCLSIYLPVTAIPVGVTETPFGATAVPVGTTAIRVGWMFTPRGCTVVKQRTSVSYMLSWLCRTQKCTAQDIHARNDLESVNLQSPEEMGAGVT